MLRSRLQTSTSSFARLLALALCLAVFGSLQGPEAAEAKRKKKNEPATAATPAPAKPDGLPTVAAKLGSLQAEPGFLRLYPDPKQGKMWLELPPPETDDGTVLEMLFAEGLATGLGSNPVGLDRGQIGEVAVLRVRRLGNRVLFEEPNPKFRALSDSTTEREATRQSFATSVHWGTQIAASTRMGAL